MPTPRRNQKIIIQAPPLDPALKLALEPEEAAERISVTRTTFYQLVRAGRVRGVQVSPQRVVYPVFELERFLRDELRVPEATLLKASGGEV